MGFLSNIISRFRRAPVNRYEGAGNSIRRSWLDTTYTSIRFDCSSSTRTQIVKKSRFFEQNNAVMNRLGDLFENYTVGSNFSVQPSSSDPEWNQAAKRAWDKWSRFPDIGSRQSFGTLMGLAARSWFYDGESFILLTQGASGRPRLQLIEAQQVATPTGMESDASVFDGVRFDVKNGRAISYFIGQEQQQNQVTDIRSISSDNVVHIFEPQRAQQLRGIPFVACVINDLHDLDDLQKLEMEACKLASSVAQVIKTASGEVQASSLRNGLASNSDAAQSYYENVFGASVKVMKHGDDFQQFLSERPGVNMREYWRNLTEKVCAGVGIPYVLVFPESMQGTVYRGSLDMSSVWFRSRHQVMASAARRIWEYVMASEIRTDPSLANPPPDWYEVAIQAPRAPNVDVGRNSAAQLAELEAGITTYDEIYGARGIDWRAALEAKAREASYINSLAIKYGIGVYQISTGQEDKPERIASEPTTPQPPAPIDPQEKELLGDPVPELPLIEPQAPAAKIRKASVKTRAKKTE